MQWGITVKEMYLHDNNYKLDDSSITFATANNFIQEFHKVEKADKQVLIHAQSIGGDWESGLSIYDVIVNSAAKVDIIGHGCLYSMGSIILQAAKKRMLLPNCVMMVHLGTSEISGEHNTVSSTVKYYEQMKKLMLNIYARRCINGAYFKEKGMSEEKVADFLMKKIRDKNDWYLLADEAVHYGFADQVLTKRSYNYARKIYKRSS